MVSIAPMYLLNVVTTRWTAWRRGSPGRIARSCWLLAGAGDRGARLGSVKDGADRGRQRGGDVLDEQVLPVAYHVPAAHDDAAHVGGGRREDHGLERGGRRRPGQPRAVQRDGHQVRDGPRSDLARVRPAEAGVP